MDVKEFVKTILKDVTEAVAESNKGDTNFYFMRDSKEGIDFDLAVISKKDASGKIGAEMFSIGAKTGGSISDEKINRIRFRIHPSMPHGKG